MSWGGKRKKSWSQRIACDMICYLVETTRVRVEFDERAGKSLDRKHFICRRSDYIFSCYHINSVGMPIFLELFKDKPHQISPLCIFNQAVYVGLCVVLTIVNLYSLISLTTFPASSREFKTMLLVLHSTSRSTIILHHFHDVHWLLVRVRIKFKLYQTLLIC